MINRVPPADDGSEESVIEPIRRMLDDLSGTEPLYRQLADRIHAGIESGALPPESRLPTVRGLADSMRLARGTVKHAYDELERRAAIEKVQGRGTFVRSRQTDEPSGKKARAMQAIDDLLDEMERMGFTPRETQIFFGLRARERSERAGFLRVMAVDCNPEALLIISQQTEQLEGVETQRFLLDDLLRSPYSPAEDADLVITTPTHYDQITQVVPEEKILRVVLSPSRDTVAELARLGDGSLGLLTSSERFASIIRRQLAIIAGKSTDIPRYVLGGPGNPNAFLAGLDTVILPDRYTRFCTPAELAALGAFRERGGAVTEFCYCIDAGSLMFLEQRAAALLAAKK